jgi:hypothetical protein
VQLSYRGGSSYPTEGGAVIQMGGVCINPLNILEVDNSSA